MRIVDRLSKPKKRSIPPHRKPLHLGTKPNTIKERSDAESAIADSIMDILNRNPIIAEDDGHELETSLIEIDNAERFDHFKAQLTIFLIKQFRDTLKILDPNRDDEVVLVDQNQNFVYRIFLTPGTQSSFEHYSTKDHKIDEDKLTNSLIKITQEFDLSDRIRVIEATSYLGIFANYTITILEDYISYTIQDGDDVYVILYSQEEQIAYIANSHDNSKSVEISYITQLLELLENPALLFKN